jgi:hypothetical protein
VPSADETNLLVQLKKTEVVVDDTRKGKKFDFSQPVICTYPAIQRCAENCSKASCRLCMMVQRPVMVVSSADGVEAYDVEDKTDTLKSKNASAVVFNSKLTKTKKTADEKKYLEKVLHCAMSVDGRTIAVATMKFGLPTSAEDQEKKKKERDELKKSMVTLTLTLTLNPSPNPVNLAASG